MSPMSNSEARKRRDLYRVATQFNFSCPPGSPVLAWPGVLTDEPLRTRTRSSAWVLPSGDPVVQVDGHAGGISLTHIAYDPTRKPAVPAIEFEPPPCPMCGESLYTDGDRFACDDCGARWNLDGTHGRWNYPDDPVEAM